MHINSMVNFSHINLEDYTNDELRYIVAIYTRRKMKQKIRTERWKEKQQEKQEKEEKEEKPIKHETKYAKEYYHNNKEKLREYRRQYYRDHYAKNAPLDVIQTRKETNDKKKTTVAKTVYPKGDFTLHFV